MCLFLFSAKKKEVDLCLCAGAPPYRGNHPIESERRRKLVVSMEDTRASLRAKIVQAVGFSERLTAAVLEDFPRWDGGRSWDVFYEGFWTTPSQTVRHHPHLSSNCFIGVKQEWKSGMAD